ncbi:hypothetical protein NDU88_003832 [Pleurodeles waltl]|uniref:Uncharacterized protein n=1 Tax=Pleurodeles waltl TaxID=8319 RepID=A0AAV7VFB5_PLEWA|nr:hypothetical protein NDU88_003832 [Pleurodeles waltl]
MWGCAEGLPDQQRTSGSRKRQLHHSQTLFGSQPELGSPQCSGARRRAKQRVNQPDNYYSLKPSASRNIPQQRTPPPLPCTNMADDMQGATMDRILQEISAVSRKLEGMDNAMVALTAETRSMCLDIAGFLSQLSGLDQRWKLK